jgi:hypothetical protein
MYGNERTEGVAMKNDDAMLLTIKDVCAIAQVTSMTVYNWRAGVRTDKTKLPSLRVTDGRRGKRTKAPGIRFREDTFLEWAEKNGVKVDAREFKRVKARAAEQTATA